ncbi:aspartyl-phosphate phosphatase Spo0E family protein [Paraclostridium bifermentans]|uniref:aspartyl-phosphate phosphatase Spo0E family protein n=1 Tax=Paraclostridium bifermentans TaxID=1490 RepID=UPI00359C9E3C
MTNNELVLLKKEIEALREEINTYIEYPDIFKEELVSTSNKIDEAINKYIKLSQESSK